MADLRLRFDASAVTRLGRQIAAINEFKTRAIQQGLNQGGGKVNTIVRRDLRTISGVRKYQSITSRVQPVKALDAALGYRIHVSGHAIPIREFPVRITASGIWAAPWNVGRVFQRSFAIGGNMDKLRQRKTEAREPLRALYGPNLAKEIEKPGMRRHIVRAVADNVPDPILARLFRPLK